MRVRSNPLNRILPVCGGDFLPALAGSGLMYTIFILRTTDQISEETRSQQSGPARSAGIANFVQTAPRIFL